jgi:hypothetical protein
MFALRDEARSLRAAETTDEVRRRLAAITREPEHKYRPVKDDWNALRRALDRDALADLEPSVRDKLRLVLADTRREVERRRAELVAQRNALAADAELRELIGPQWIALHASLVLGDATARWGVVIGGDASNRASQDGPGQYGRVQGALLAASESDRALGAAPPGFVVQTVDRSLPHTRVLVPAPLVHSGETAGLFGIYNLAIATAQDRLPREGTPDDTLDRLDLGRVRAQAEAAGSLLLAVANHPALSVARSIAAERRYFWPRFDGKVSGPRVMGVLLRQSVPNTPVAGAVVRFRPVVPGQFDSLTYDREKPVAFERDVMVRTDRNGSYAVGPLFSSRFHSWSAFAASFDERGAVVSVSDQPSGRTPDRRINTFRCWGGALPLPPQVTTKKLETTGVLVMSARSSGRLETKKSNTGIADGVTYWWAHERVRGVKLFGLPHVVGLNAADGPRRRRGMPLGRGFGRETGVLGRRITRTAADDLWRLNESRLAILRERDVRDSSVEELHGRAEDALRLDPAGAEPAPLVREAGEVSAFWASQPVYRSTRRLLDDLVVAVLILLGLSVPFAFAAERLVIGATSIYRQIAWFAAIFVATFLVLYVTHPAFAVANTPVIIFQGFIILVISGLVISLLMRKFEAELRVIQGMTKTVHAADVSRFNTFIAAMQMGISTMRRRPLRTALTAVTVVLLTFTILCFASFGTELGIVTLFVEPNPSYAGVFVHAVNWDPLSRDLVGVIGGRYGRDGLHRRLWMCPQKLDQPGVLLTREDGSKPLTLSGVLGLDPAELARRGDLSEVLDGLAADAVLLTGSVARELGVKPGDRIVLLGRSLRVGPLLDAVRIARAKDMDGSSILPADFTQASTVIAGSAVNRDRVSEANAAALLAAPQWAALPADRVAVVSANTAEAMGAELYALTLYTGETARSAAVADELARLLPFPVAATRANGVFRHILGTVVAASGVESLFFPVLLGGLVIFGTMLGSVADRQREIYAFSALGLAPKHVATLFLAESTVYSLLGGMLGYLLAQGSVKALGLLAGYGVPVPEVNLSTTNTMVTILIVMATVMISAVYPAIKASRSANPGLMRMWRPPEPVGDTQALQFPFTVSRYDATGVMSFLREHFQNHDDVGLGRFVARGTRIVTENDALGLRAELSLAPFDLGVNQAFLLTSGPSEIAGIDVVHVRVDRLSGQPNDWRRLNKRFFDDLRRQFLIWRSLPRESMEQYREETLAVLGAESEKESPRMNTDGHG